MNENWVNPLFPGQACPCEVPHNFLLPKYRTWARERPHKYCSEFIPTRIFNGPFSNQDFELDPEMYYGQWRGYNRTLSFGSPRLSFSYELRAKNGLGYEENASNAWRKKSRGPERQRLIMPHSFSIPAFRLWREMLIGECTFKHQTQISAGPARILERKAEITLKLGSSVGIDKISELLCSYRLPGV